MRVIEFLISHGADVNAQDSGGETPLHKAARKNHCDAYRALVAGGALESIRNAFRETPANLMHDLTKV